MIKTTVSTWLMPQTRFCMSYSAVSFIFYINSISSDTHKHIRATISVLNKCPFFFCTQIQNMYLVLEFQRCFLGWSHSRIRKRKIIGVCVCEMLMIHQATHHRRCTHFLPHWISLLKCYPQKEEQLSSVPNYEVHLNSSESLNNSNWSSKSWSFFNIVGRQ